MKKDKRSLVGTLEASLVRSKPKGQCCFCTSFGNVQGFDNSTAQGCRDGIATRPPAHVCIHAHTHTYTLDVKFPTSDVRDSKRNILCLTVLTRSADKNGQKTIQKPIFMLQYITHMCVIQVSTHPSDKSETRRVAGTTPETM